MLGVYNYTVILTYIGTLIGFFGITFALQGKIHSALICLLISGFCDMFDGKIASTKKRTDKEKRLGIQIDSLSDLICFGILPALIIYRISKFGTANALISALYVLCALIRLAWFNVDEESRQEQETKEREVYYGLPVTISALIFPILLGLCQRYHWPDDILGSIIMLSASIAFLTPFPLKKPKWIGKIGMLILGAAGLALHLTVV